MKGKNLDRFSLDTNPILFSRVERYKEKSVVVEESRIKSITDQWKIVKKKCSLLIFSNGGQRRNRVSRVPLIFFTGNALLSRLHRIFSKVFEQRQKVISLSIKFYYAYLIIRRRYLIDCASRKCIASMKYIYTYIYTTTYVIYKLIRDIHFASRFCT